MTAALAVYLGIGKAHLVKFECFAWRNSSVLVGDFRIVWTAAEVYEWLLFFCKRVREDKAVEEMRNEAKKEEHINTSLKDIKTVMRKLSNTAEAAMEFLDIPKEEWPIYKARL